MIVYRASSPSNGWGRVEFNLNHGAPHYLRNRQFEKLELPAGDVTISHDNMLAQGMTKNARSISCYWFHPSPNGSTR